VRSLGIAIATYNRAELTVAAFRAVYDDPRVTCVGISDDCSSREEFIALAQHIERLRKVKLGWNLQNLGSWANKRKAVELCKAEWAALIDSDNTVGSDYLDALCGRLMDGGSWDEDTLYLPERGLPALDYSAYSGTFLTRENAVLYLDAPTIQMALNTGNFFVHRKSYLEVSNGPVEQSYASDGIYFVYRWLASGRRALIVPGLSYHHLVHNGHWSQTALQSTAFATELVRRMQNGIWEAPCVA
jgi:glycosyl transferase family 2